MIEAVGRRRKVEGELLDRDGDLLQFGLLEEEGAVDLGQPKAAPHPERPGAASCIGRDGKGVDGSEVIEGEGD